MELSDRLTPMGGTGPLPHPTAHKNSLAGRSDGSSGPDMPPAYPRQRGALSTRLLGWRRRAPGGAA